MFSIIIPVYNKFPHLERSIFSVLNQTVRDFELILIDDSSTDGSYEKIQEFKDPRIRIFQRSIPGPGGYAARNLGITNAKNEWISFLDADDEWEPDYLEKVKDVILATPNSEIVTTGWEELNGNFFHKNLKKENQALVSFDLADYLNDPILVWTSATSIKKSLLVTVGGFPSDKPCRNGGDVDTWIRSLFISKKNTFINAVLAKYYRDTVNRVTNYKTNKSNIFCAYDTLMSVYSNADSKTRSGIKRFVNKNIYNILRRNLDNNGSIDYRMIKKMYLTKYSLSRILKLYFLFLTNKFKINATK